MAAAGEILVKWWEGNYPPLSEEEKLELFKTTKILDFYTFEGIEFYKWNFEAINEFGMSETEKRLLVNQYETRY